jgi:carbon storage regulator
VLILNRRKNESLVINNDIIVTVVEIRGDKVRLAIVAPKEVPVHRQEVHDAIHGLWPARPSPPEEKAFVQAIEEGPGDEGLRLVFADWLEERGDPLGEFLRLRCRLARLSADDPLRAGLEERERALWGEHGRAWAATLPAALWAPTALPPA